MTGAAPRFDMFVLLAGMRTGSNLLEEHLNALAGVTCAGELFNPHFVGHRKQQAWLGYDLTRREADPLGMVAALRAQPGLCGFRLFHDHDPRVLEQLLPDPRCAKILLTRNPLDSYISRKIAAATDQWKLGDVKHKRAAQVRFDPAEFESHVLTTQGFHERILHGLQISGQAPFVIGYDDLADLEVLNGLAQWLGVPARFQALSGKLKRQNPELPQDKVLNPEALHEGIARLDRFDLARIPGTEPRRGARVGTWRRAVKAPVLFMPIPGGPEGPVLDWLAGLDGVARGALPPAMTVPELRGWQGGAPGRVCFTVLRHPLARAHDVYLRQVVEGTRSGVRGYLQRVHGIDLPPAEALDQTYDLELHRAGFLAYLRFVQANLAGQTGLPVQPPWASQTMIIEGFRQQCVPDRLLHEATLPRDLARIAADLGVAHAPGYAAPPPRHRFALAETRTPEIDAACRAAYGMDYRMLGFDDLS